MRRSLKPPSIHAAPLGQPCSEWSRRLESTPPTLRPPEMSQMPPPTSKVRVPLSLGQFLRPPPPQPLPHLAAPVWTRATGGGAALSWDSARRLGFLWENVRNDVSAPEWWISRGRGAGRGAGELGPVQLCRRRLSHSCPPSPGPDPGPGRDPALPAAGGAQSPARSAAPPPRRAPPAGRAGKRGRLGAPEPASK